MPVTPLHIGIPGLISFYFPRRVDIMSVVIGSVIIDIDFFLFLYTGSPIHGFFHTFLGATTISVLLVMVLKLSAKPILRIKEWFKWEPESSLKSLSIGALIGTYSHVILDSLMYNNLDPYYPHLGNPHYLENGHETIFIAVYVIGAVTTLTLMILYTWKYFKALEAEKMAVRL